MDRKVSKRRWPQFLVIAVLLLLFLFGGYYFIYVSHQKAYLTDRNFRLLGVTSQQVQGQLNNLNDAWKRMNEELISKSGKDLYKNCEGFEEEAKWYINNISGLEKAKIAFEFFQTQDEYNKKSAEPSEEFEVERNRDTVKAYFRFQPRVPVKCKFTEKNNKNGQCNEEECYVTIKARSDLAPLLTSLVNRSEFDDVLVVNKPEDPKDEYEVLFQRESRGIQILTLPLPLQKNQANRLETIELGGARYKVFLQPVQWSLSTSSDETQKLQWFVCGLVRADRFLSESFSFPIPMLLGLVVLLPTAFLAWPFLKLWFMRPRERLSTWDAVFLLFSLLFGSALFILLLLNIYAYWQLEENIDQQLKSLSENIHTNLNTELDDIHKQLTDSMYKMTHKVPASQEEEKENKPIFLGKKVKLNDYSTYPYFDLVFLVDRSGDQRGKWDVQAQTTPQINLHERPYVKRILYCSSWVGLRNGEMRRFYVEPIFSWNTGENLTVYSVPLGYDIPLEYPFPQEYYIDPIKCPKDPKGSGKELAVAALATHPVSLTKPVIPPGFGYAVINAKGLVLFHVDNTRNLRENLFDETARNKRLRSAVFGHTAEWIDASYGGTPHRLYVRPIDGLPWFLIVYRDKELLSTARLEIFSVAVILALVYFSMLVVLLLLYLWLSGDRFRWLWPTPTQTAAYRRVGVINLVLCILLCMWVWVWGGIVPEWLWSLPCVVMVIVPVLEFVLIYCVLDRGWSLGFPKISMGVQKRDSGWFRFVYVFAMASIFLTLSVFPMLAFFKVAHDAEMTLLIKHGQLEITKAIEKREDRVKDQYLNVNVDNRDLFIQKRLKLEKALDIYASFFFSTEIKHSALSKVSIQKEASWFEWVLRTISPLYSETSLDLRGVSGPGSADQLWPPPSSSLLAWAWGPRKPQQKQLILTKNRVESESSLRITSTIPVLGEPIEGYGWIILLVGLVVFLVLLYASVRLIARRVFLRDVLDPQRPLNLPALQARVVSDNLLVIGSPFAGKSAWLQQRVQQDDWQVIDFHRDSETRNDEMAELESYKVIALDHKVIALDHFEYQLGVPEQDHAKLLLLEKLLSTHQQGGVIIVVSTVDPVALYGGDSAGREVAAGTAPASSHERDSWARIFSSFLTVYLNDEENAQDFAHVFSGARERIVERAGSLAAKHQCQSLSFLENECRPTAYLREVGRSMVTAPAFAEYTTENLKKVIWDRVCAYYQVVWSTCSPGEQFLLICLAEDRFVNTRNPDIDRLLRKRLIVRDPKLRLMNASFEQFVRSATPPPQASTWEEEVRHSGWNMLKGPLLGVLVVVGLFLYATQPDLFNATTAFVSAVAAGGLPALLKLFSTVVPGDKAQP